VFGLRSLAAQAVALAFCLFGGFTLLACLLALFPPLVGLGLIVAVPVVAAVVFEVRARRGCR